MNVASIRLLFYSTGERGEDRAPINILISLLLFVLASVSYSLYIDALVTSFSFDSPNTFTLLAGITITIATSRIYDPPFFSDSRAALLACALLIPSYLHYAAFDSVAYPGYFRWTRSLFALLLLHGYGISTREKGVAVVAGALAFFGSNDVFMIDGGELPPSSFIPPLAVVVRATITTACTLAAWLLGTAGDSPPSPLLTLRWYGALALCGAFTKELVQPEIPRLIRPNFVGALPHFWSVLLCAIVAGAAVVFFTVNFLSASSSRPCAMILIAHAANGAWMFHLLLALPISMWITEDTRWHTYTAGGVFFTSASLCLSVLAIKTRIYDECK